LVGYKNGGADIKALVLVGKGSGGVDELAAQLDNNQVLFAEPCIVMHA